MILIKTKNETNINLRILDWYNLFNMKKTIIKTEMYDILVYVKKIADSIIIKKNKFFKEYNLSMKTELKTKPKGTIRNGMQALEFTEFNKKSLE